MKFIKVGFMGLIMLLISNVMITRANADEYLGFNYYDTGSNTSTDSAIDHDTALDDSDLLKYKVIEENVKEKTSSTYKMSHYLASSKAYYTIPGLNNTNVLGKDCTTMVPQGICTMDSYVLITAYDSSAQNKSVIYVLDNNNVLKATLVYCNKNHLGGVTYDGSYIWISEGGDDVEVTWDNYVGAISKSTILNAIKVSSVKKAKSVALKNITHIKRQQVSTLSSTSYCTYFDSRLWVGTFDKDNKSDIYGYKIDYSYDTPKLKVDRYIEAPKKTQGICFYKTVGKVYMGVSTSYGRQNNSVIICYRPKDYYEPKKKYKGIMQISLNDAYKKITMPPMSEQISIRGIAMYCIFESAAYKYLNQHDNIIEGALHINHSERPIGSFCIFSTDKIFK